MTTVSKSGGTLYFQQSGTGIQYQYNSTVGTWTNIPIWPFTVINTSLTSILYASFQTNLTFDNNAYTNMHFEVGAGSNIVNFKGNNNIMSIENFPTFGGLIRNPGLNPVFIQNMNLTQVNSVLAPTSGWLTCNNFTNGQITKCTSDSTCITSLYQQGLFFGYQTSNTTCNFCYSLGNIVGGGIFASGSTNCIANNCFSIGTITGSSTSADGSGGIFGPSCDNTNEANYCYSIGNIIPSAFTGNAGSGGICGSNCGVVVSNCYSMGTIGTAVGICGGIFGSGSTGLASNCYSSGSFANSNVGIGGTTALTTCYSANNAWSDSAAQAKLTGCPVSVTSSNPGATWTSLATNSPYVLSSFNEELYDPNYDTATSISYTSSPSIFAGAPNHFWIINTTATYTDVVDSTTGTLFFYNDGNPGLTTAYMFAFQTSNFQEGVPPSLPYNYNINYLKVDFGSEPICFSEGTKILCCDDKGNDIYRKIETLRSGDLVKTYKHGIKKIMMIGKNVMVNDIDKPHNCMFTLYKTKENGLTENLTVTGGHSLLVDDLGDLAERNKEWLGENYKIEDKYLLVCALNPAFVPLDDQEVYNYYHFVIQNGGDDNARFGVWANGALTETPSFNQFIQYKLNPIE